MPVNTPLPDVREAPVATPEAVEVDVVGIVGGGRDAVDAAALERQHDARLLAQDAQPPAAAHVGVRHLPGERLSLERQPADARARRAARDPSPTGSNVTSIAVQPRADDRHRRGLRRLRRLARGLRRRPRTPPGTRPSSRSAHVREAPARTVELEVVDDDARRARDAPRRAPRAARRAAPRCPPGR